MLMRVINTDRDGDSNNMFSSYDVILIWRVRYRKVLKLIVAYKVFFLMALSRILRQVISLDKKGKPWILWVFILLRIMSDVSLSNNGSYDRIHLDANMVQEKMVSILATFLVSWSWIEDLGTHRRENKYFGNWHFSNLYTNFKQLCENKCWILRISRTLNRGSEWALYLLKKIILMKRFCNFSIL